MRPIDDVQIAILKRAAHYINLQFVRVMANSVDLHRRYEKVLKKCSVISKESMAGPVMNDRDSPLVAKMFSLNVDTFEKDLEAYLIENKITQARAYGLPYHLHPIKDEYRRGFSDMSVTSLSGPEIEESKLVILCAYFGQDPDVASV